MLQAKYTGITALAVFNNKLIAQVDIFFAYEISKGSLKIELTENNIEELIQRAKAFVEAQTENNNISIVLYNNLPTNRDVIRCDKEQVEVVFMNLISNAVKYSEKGSRVSVTLSINNDLVTIEVKDQGFGIAQNNLKDIWERFIHINPSTMPIGAPGIGVGLSIVKGIIEKHGWKITVESKENQGSNFIIEIPSQEVTLRKKVLYVGEDLAQLLKEDLEETGKYLIIVGSWAGNLLTETNREKPDVILIDVPSGSSEVSINACQELSSKESDSIIIVLTVDSRIGERCKGKGASDWLQKPFKVYDLITKIESHLKKVGKK